MRAALTGMGWEGCRQVLTPKVLRDGKTHVQMLAWTAGADSLRAELQVSLLVDEQNQAQGYLLLAR